MRPVRRGPSPQPDGFERYQDAKPHLVARMGPYCSYCERPILTQLAVEHIQPKGLPQYAHLERRWDNLLLGCVNCNAHKGDNDVLLGDLLLPDRDNTFVAFDYRADGTVRPSSSSGHSVRQMGANTLALVGLDRRSLPPHDENGKMIALDRVAQRMETWSIAQEAQREVARNPGNEDLRRMTVRLAQSKGFFSIWMTVFQGDTDMRVRLLDAFPGTRDSGCFDAATTHPIPAPNPDGLPHGGKV